MFKHILPQLIVQSSSDSNGTRSIRASAYETEVIHPATGRWLTEHGYTYRHEVVVQDYGRIDFVAIHEDGHVLVVECKSSCSNFSSTIRQIKGYQSHIGGQARAAIAVPQAAITEHARESCKRQAIALIELDVPIPRIEHPVNQSLEEAVQRLLDHRIEWGELANDISYLILQLDTPAAQGYWERLIKALNDRSTQNRFSESIDSEESSESEDIICKIIEYHRNQGKSYQWICAWFGALYFHATFTDVLQQVLCESLSPLQLDEIIDTMRLGLWKRDTQQLRNELGLVATTNLPDHLPILGLLYEAVAEEISGTHLAQNDDLEYDEAKQIVRSDGAFVGKQADAAGKRLGIDIPTGRPLLPAQTKGRA